MKNKSYLLAIISILLIGSSLILNFRNNNQDLSGNLASKINNIKQTQSSNNQDTGRIDTYKNSPLLFDSEKQSFVEDICLQFDNTFAANNPTINVDIDVSVTDGTNSYTLDRSIITFDTATIMSQTISGVTTYQYCKYANSFPLSSTINLEIAKSYTAQLKVDPDNKYKEIDASGNSGENNNSSSLTFNYDIPLSYKPDIKASTDSITVIPIVNYDKETDQFSYQICVDNFANAIKYYNGKQFRINLFANNVNNYNTFIFDSTKVINGCYWQNAVYVSSSVIHKAGDTISVSLSLDVDKVIGESNENNNLVTKTIVF